MICNQQQIDLLEEMANEMGIEIKGVCDYQYEVIFLFTSFNTIRLSMHRNMYLDIIWTYKVYESFYGEMVDALRQVKKCVRKFNVSVERI